MHTFGEIVGQDAIKKAMQSAIANKKISHAYVLEGQKGMGKMLLANTFAKTCFCEQGGIEPCNTCISCITFDAGSHTDTIYVKPEKTKHLGVDDIREQITRAMEIKPYCYPRKICIVEDAGHMSVAAQNALLKTLEEPPEYGMIILLVENCGMFLPTILSRCVAFSLKPLSLLQVSGFLEAQGNIPKELCQLAAVYAKGSIGAALFLATSEEFSHMRSTITNILMGISSKELHQLFALAKEWASFKETMQEALDIAFMWFRDVAVYIETKNTNLLLQRDLQGQIIKESQNTNVAAVFLQLEAVWQAKNQLRQNANFDLVIEVLLMKLSDPLCETI